MIEGLIAVAVIVLMIVIGWYLDNRDPYVGKDLVTLDSYGNRQVRKITKYNRRTSVITVASDWPIPPNASSVFRLPHDSDR
jgi:hypothetical protein